MMRELHRIIWPLMIFGCWICGMPLTGSATESGASPDTPASPGADTAPHFLVRGYTVEGVLLSTNILVPLFSKYSGTNVSLPEIIKAASDLQSAYHDQGYPAMSVAFVPEQITDGIVTFNVAQTAIPQIVVAGERYLSFSNGLEVVSRPPVVAVKPPTRAGVITNFVPPIHPNPILPEAGVETRRATYPEMVDALAAMRREMSKLESRAKDTRIHVISTNAGPRFAVEKYLVGGNSILPSAAIGQVITNIDGAFGTNVGFDGIETVVSELGKAYHERGFITVAVNVPQQKLTNATVKLQVLEGRLADIHVDGNRYFSSNNVMRSLPSLHTNMVLNGPIFNAELNRANANQDRQIYPVIGPGPEPGSSALTLNVKDRVPFHVKLELNNQSSPGTPDMRVNGSAVYDNLWQREHSIGMQYGFSPEVYKAGDSWNFYDQPLVAYYSGFYRLPLGNPEPIENTVANSRGSFGYNEATRQFNLPPPSGQPELTLYANRATIDTGIENPGSSILATTTSSNSISTLSEQSIHQDITINQGLGFQLTQPLPEINGVRSILSGGLDYKAYSLTSYETNIITTTTAATNLLNGQVTTTAQSVIKVTPPTYSTLDYLPLSLNYNASLQDAFGPATAGLGSSANLWYSSSFFSGSSSSNSPPTSLNGVASLRKIINSDQASGHWVILRPSVSQEIDFYTNWVTSFRADGQWASEPVLSTEQFGAGGVNSVRGYHEGEVFGDTGWHLSLDQQTPPCIVGMIRDGTPLTVRGSAYMDYARVYLLDPQGRQGSTPLWGTGFGFSASAGSHWQAQFLFSWPLLSAGTVPAGKPFFNFSLTAQF